VIERLQASADRNIACFGLLEEQKPARPNNFSIFADSYGPTRSEASRNSCGSVRRTSLN
jgi:hypothetical protein